MREEKKFLLEEVKEKIEKSDGFIVASYKGFSAPRVKDFRNKMAEIGGEFEVVKKRVFIKAAETLGIDFNLQALSGHVGVIFAHDDAMAVAKGAVKYGEDNNNILSVLGGKIDGERCSAEDVEVIAKLPSLNELRAQILGLFEAPMAQTVGAIQAVLTSVLYCLEEKSKKE